jgi:hypothetical protein
MSMNTTNGRIRGTTIEDVKGEWRKWRNEKLHNLHSSPRMTAVIRSRSVRFVIHVARM